MLRSHITDLMRLYILTLIKLIYFVVFYRCFFIKIILFITYIFSCSLAFYVDEMYLLDLLSLVFITNNYLDYIRVITLLFGFFYRVCYFCLKNQYSDLRWETNTYYNIYYYDWNVLGSSSKDKKLIYRCIIIIFVYFFCLFTNVMY